MKSQTNTSGSVSNGDDRSLSQLIDDLQVATGLRYLKTEIGVEIRGGTRYQYPSPFINYSSCQYRLINDTSATTGAGKDEVDETTSSEYSSHAATDVSSDNNSDATGDVGRATSKNFIHFNQLAPELRNKIYTYYAQDTDNIPAGPIEIGLSINGQYIHPRRNDSFNLNILLVSRAVSKEALPFIKAELSTRRFILTDYDGGVLQSRVEQDMLRIFGDCMQTVTLHGGAMMNVLSALGPRKLKTVDIICATHRVYSQIRVEHELEADWTRELAEIALQDSCKNFVQIFLDNTVGVPLILSSYAGAVAAYPEIFVPEREWQVRSDLPMYLEVAEGDGILRWKFTVWFDGDLGRVVKFERK